MAEKTKSEKTQKKSWFQGLQSEFNKIIWTSRENLIKQTTAVVVITAILAVIIAVLDAAILQGVNLIM